MYYLNYNNNLSKILSYKSEKYFNGEIDVKLLNILARINT